MAFVLIMDFIVIILCLLLFALNVIKVRHFTENSIGNCENFSFCICLMEHLEMSFTLEKSDIFSL